jgi:hypothetical protein
VPSATATASATASASASRPVEFAVFPKVTLELPEAMTADQRKTWEAHASELGACSKFAAGTCARRMTVSRSADGKAIVHPTAGDCKAPASTACVEKAAGKAEIPTGATVGISFKH